MSGIQTDRVLPPELCIQSIDDILYSIGLCHDSVRDRPKRSVIHHPMGITIFLSIHVLTCIVSNTTDDETILLLTSDLGHYMGIKGITNLMVIMLSSMALFSQMVYYYNHCIGVKPTFVRVFQVLSGSITPSNIGLNHSKQVEALLKIAKWLPLLKKNNTILIPSYSFWFVFGVHVYGLGFINSLIRSIYPVLFYILWCYYSVNILSIQIFLFYILCKYFLIKLKELNRLLREEKRMNANRIWNIRYKYNFVYSEINEYNSTYWSKFLFIIWLLLGNLNVFIIYVITFITMPIFIRFSMMYFLSLYITMFLFILSITSSVNLEANKTYALLNSFILNFGKTSKLHSKHIINYKMKVFICFILNTTFNSLGRTKTIPSLELLYCKISRGCVTSNK